MKLRAEAPTHLPRRAMALLVALAALAAVAVGWGVWPRPPQPAVVASDQPVAADAVPRATPLSTTPTLPRDPVLAQAEGPSFDVVRVGHEGGLVLAGQASPGATVTITAGEAVIATATADSTGAWVAAPASPLQPGVGELSLSSTDPGGGVHPGVAPALVVVPDRPAARATAASLPPMAVLVPPSAPSLLLQSPGPAATVPGTKLSLGTVDYDDRGAIRFSGNAPPHTALRIYADGAVLGDATASAAGSWALSPAHELTPGLHRLRVDQLGDDAQVVSRIELPFEREVLALSQVKPGHVLVQPGENLWRLARHVYGSGLRYTVIFRANRDQIRDARLIYPGQVFRAPGARRQPPV